MQSLASLVRHHARRAPDAVAVVHGADRLTYGELDEQSDRLAGALLAAGVGPGDRVVLLVPRSTGLIRSVFGVLKGRGVYVPLEIDAPAARLVPRIAAAEPRVVIAHPRAAHLLGAVRAAAPAAVLWTGDPPPGAARPGGGPVPLPEGRRDDLAYLLFTSGSTGVPKGVPITHDSVLTFATWVAGELGIGPDDRVSGHSALSFDFSVFDLYGAMAAGAALHLVPEHLNLVPDLLAGFIRESRLTQWSSVPSVMTAMAGRGVVRDFPDLRRVVWSGDVFPAPALRHWMLALPGVPFTNLFGPTETTVASCIATLSVPPGAADPIPIGRAVGGDRVALLDDDLRPVPAGTIGELYFAGAGLSPGYWRDPGATEQAFRVVDGTRWYRTGDLATLGPDGLYYFHGRRDRQVKSRGYRIELDEITAAAGRLTGVVAAAVVAVDAPGLAGRELCAAYVPAGGAALDPARLRAELSATLPTYMLPTRWLALDRLPVNTNGKIDHGAVVRVFEDVAAAPSHG